VKDARPVPLLVEIGCEEIPARFLSQATREFGARIERALSTARLLTAEDGQERDVAASTSRVRTYSTPRRLIASVPGILTAQPDQVEEITGPPVRVAFDDQGNPTRAAESFAEKNQVPIRALTRKTTAKGEYLALRQTVAGRPALELLKEILPAATLGLAWPKSMVWAGKQGPRFVRPIRWILALLGEGPKAKVIPFEIAGVRSGKQTFGHRSYSPRPIPVSGFKDYRKKLAKARVEIDPEARRQRVKTQIKVLLEKLKLITVEDMELEDWTDNSTEWPRPILGEFDPRFLALPREILVAVMRGHQKYFAVEDRKGKLQPRFIGVINLDSDPRGYIRSGHQRVLLARFRDAEFFWQADQRRPLGDRTELLKNVTFQAELGTYAEKVARMIGLTRGIAELASAAGLAVDMDIVARAAKLSKCDLTTQMVQEFPELQGVVGGIYARAQGESEEVAQAIYDHYRPTGLEDAVPRTLAGAVVSLADKLDSVAGGFATGQAPSGSSDPFALRRQANGIVKVLLELPVPISLRPVVERALVQLDVEWRAPREEVFGLVMEFFAERLAYYLETARGLGFDTVRAVLAAGWEVPSDALRRAEALEGIRGTEDFKALSAAAKRIKNILSKSATEADWVPGEVNMELLRDKPERKLFQEFSAVEAETKILVDAGDYAAALGRIAQLRPAVDLFFDKVLVMAEDRRVRENRLRLLSAIDGLFSSIAHFALTAGEGKG
jgi:glycyl-tRNA synthetase beta chain